MYQAIIPSAWYLSLNINREITDRNVMAFGTLYQITVCFVHASVDGGVGVGGARMGGGSWGEGD